MTVIPQQTLSRLPRYFRFIRRLLLEDKLRVSSSELGEAVGITPSQVRSDLSYIENRGQQGYGYYVKPLYAALSKSLGVCDGFRAIIVCHRPCCLLDDGIFESRGVTLSAVFGEVTENTVSYSRAGLYGIGSLEDFAAGEKPDIAILLPLSGHSENEMAERLERLGIKAIWNFTKSEIKCGIPVKNLILSDILMTICCELHIASESFEAEKEKEYDIDG